MTTRGRPYAGASREARESARREQIIAAGIELFGTQGYRAATVGAVCERAGLNKRYFYESFAALEDLLVEVYERVVADLRAAVLAGGGADSGGSDGATVAPGGEAMAVLRGFMGGFLGWAQDNPIFARVHLFEVLGVSARIDELYRRHGRVIGGELADSLAAAISNSGLSDTRRRVLGDLLVGAGIQIVVDWVIGDYQPPKQELLTEVESTLDWVLTAGMGGED
ncbi:TetR/AcrR family transcriptional regulator [Brevibacterium spongiae]|uniref:TetR/AcrR family transcriptional regulator n=1 Tax=Brevibacterium spongiae TaxID=2909672 RepID=A0ABY5ST09_9MICO|nr:TetR/AcrR family transcriptional regulator [Brevibacterium spongiae]UVI36241.1 TetR/AcrR family transcriptional regulator [Brevibacterium spongiae]